MMQMVKLDIDGLRRAYEGKSAALIHSNARRSDDGVSN